MPPANEGLKSILKNPTKKPTTPKAKASTPRKRVSIAKQHNWYITGERRDLPERTMAEAEAERVACFERAWAQKRAREERTNLGSGWESD